MNKLLLKLPEYLESSNCVDNRGKENVASLWKQFSGLYETMNTLHPPEENILNCHTVAKKNRFLFL